MRALQFLLHQCNRGRAGLVEVRQIREGHHLAGVGADPLPRFALDFNESQASGRDFEVDLPDGTIKRRHIDRTLNLDHFGDVEDCPLRPKTLRQPHPLLCCGQGRPTRRCLGRGRSGRRAGGLRAFGHREYGCRADGRLDAIARVGHQVVCARSMCPSAASRDAGPNSTAQPAGTSMNAGQRDRLTPPDGVSAGAVSARNAAAWSSKGFAIAIESIHGAIPQFLHIFAS